MYQEKGGEVEFLDLEEVCFPKSVLTIFFFLSFLRLEVECKTSERNLKKSKDKWEAYDSEVSEAETKLREMNKERESLENEGEKIVESVKNFEKEMDEVTTSLKEVKESLTKLEEYETQYKAERIETFKISICCIWPPRVSWWIL